MATNRTIPPILNYGGGGGDKVVILPRLYVVEFQGKECAQRCWGGCYSSDSWDSIMLSGYRFGSISN